VVIFSKDDVKCRSVAERYGFKNVWTATDVNANFPDLWPFRNDHPEAFKELAPDQQIDAALVFNDPAYIISWVRLIPVTGEEIHKLSLILFSHLIGHLEILHVSRNRLAMALGRLLFSLRTLHFPCKVILETI